MYGKKKCNKRNTITYEIQPDEKIAISLCVEDRDGKGKIAQKDFIFDYKKELSGRTSPDAYTRLFEEIRSGNQTLFVSMDEMEASWKFIDRIIESWSGAGAAHLLSYKKENARKMREKALAMLQ
jgi:glucose-6-phosphate 1-dehydrogenase